MISQAQPQRHMRQIILIFSFVFTLSCNSDNEPIAIDLSNVTLNSKIIERPNGSFEYEVFEVEEGNIRIVNTQSNPLRKYSFGLTTSTDAHGNPIGIGLASFNEDLVFVDLKGFQFEEVVSIPDSLVRFKIGINIDKDDIIGIISKTRQLKIKVKSASFGLDGNKTPQSEFTFMGEYL